MPDLILATTSPYKIELFERLNFPFETAKPDIDENPKPGESAQQLAARLAREKALRVAQSNPGRWVLGSDQSASVNGDILFKPGDHSTAQSQLEHISGQQVTFYSAVCLVSPADQRIASACSAVEVSMRTLSEAEIEYYLNTEKPYDCVGSFKCEGLGISLFEAVRSTDPTALIGLPLIAVTDLLREAELYPPITARPRQ